jgi:2-polyprenyl-3-methyl-5-hydroxy-6-metoxy-1,4-benzoquinol methylase
MRRLNLMAEAIESYRQRTGKQSPRVLDVGCGNGQISIPLASLGCEMVGIDSDPQSVEVARETNSFENAVFLVQDALALEVDGTFDAVICSEILEHVSEPLQLLESLAPRLDEGGLLLMTVPNGYTLEEILRRFLTRTTLGLAFRGLVRRWLLREKTVQTENVESPHLQYFTFGSIRSLMKRAQLQVAHEASWTTFFMPFYYIFLRLFVSRDSCLFRHLDRWDAVLAERLPMWAGGGWFFAAERASETGAVGGPMLATLEESR